MNPKVRLIIPIVLISASFLMISRYLGEREELVERRRLLMGTVVEIKVPVWKGDDKRIIEYGIEEAFKEIERVESVFSVFKNDSEITKINKLKAADVHKASDEMFELVERSIEYNKTTKGAFDITIKPLVDLWGINRNKGKVPSDAEVKKALADVGSQNIILDKANKTISFIKEGMGIDLGGIAKGYATDRAIAALKESGIRSAIVNSGGDMYCLGRRSANKLWKVGIQHPRRKDAILFEIVLEDKAIDTSGDYEKFFLIEGKRYSHIINPRTGYPVRDRVISATAIAGDSATADALATALCIIGEEGLHVVKSIPGTDAIILSKEDDKLRVKMSEGIKTRYDIVESKI